MGLPLAVVRAAARTYGGRGLLRRARYEAERRTGILERRERTAATGTPWSAFRVEAVVDVHRVRSWVASGEASGELRDQAAATGAALLDGMFALYGGAVVDIGWPPAWHVDPFTRSEIQTGLHWSALTDESRSIDVKDVWELSRMSWIGPLLRAYALTADDRWPEALWVALTDWQLSNPPYSGVNWMSGQEVAVRGMAVMFAAAALKDHPASTPERLATAGGLVRDSVRRVQATLRYAQSQRNNHAIAEAAFLFAAAALCPMLPDHARMQRRARGALREAVLDQFLPDGSYAQHSFMYQRLALHALLFASWAAEQSGERADPAIVEALSRSVGFLASMADQDSGWLPNTGSNDGALLFRLSGCHARDFRPVLAHAAARARLPSPFTPGAWTEEAVWFGLEVNASVRREPPTGVLTPGGYHVQRGPASHALLRAGPLRHRPGHADQLNVDVWIGGLNVVRDPGTYRYSGPAPWRNALAAEAVHSVPLAHNVIRARRLGRFFWVDWPQARTVMRVATSDGEVVVAEFRPPNSRGVVVRRLLARVGDSYVVADRLTPAHGVVRWNLPPGTDIDSAGVTTQASNGAFVATFLGGVGCQRRTPRDDDPASGWESTTYAERSSVTVLVVPVDVAGFAVAAFAGEQRFLPLPAAVDPWRKAVAAGTEDACRAALTASAFSRQPQRPD